MALLIRQLECLQCSHNRNFVVHSETAQRLVSQAELRDLPRNMHLTCPRCGSASLISVWSDGIPYAAQGMVPRRRRARRVAADL
jgi:hypothetical protein